MGDLGIDTAIEGGDGRYRATLSPDWKIWGPNGGYLATIALRAAGAETSLRRPATFYCQLLSMASFGPVELAVETLRASKKAAALQVTMTQGERPVLRASVWVVDDGVDGLEHDVTAMPEVPGPEQLDDMRKLEPEFPSSFPFWSNFDYRPVGWVPRAERKAGDPVVRDWLRFVPRSTFDDPFVDAGRHLVVIDTLTWPAASRRHRDSPFIAPNMDLAVHFHRAVPDSEWLLGDGIAPLAEDGLIACRTNSWTPDGRLAASGVCQLICRPRPA